MAVELRVHVRAAGRCGETGCRRRQFTTAARPTRSIRATCAKSTRSPAGETGSRAASGERRLGATVRTARRSTEGRTTSKSEISRA
ncbi:hypothetical protein GCM10010347_42820 [Streptomyces cirratus]|uniref:Uncharacterized protein n=1 Tax=Streptomyces cirratus TaxID=68187 RepID=A0ABQ3F0J3_9ACTN|nr:hypothetical protein GCM10010347_42820 [Streptomyces cirratus]